MANKYTNLNDLFTAMANAIRLKNGSTSTIIADNFPTEIANLKTRFDYNNQNVTVLPDYAFYGCEDLNNVDCPNLTSVGASAFENCKSLKTMILYGGVESVGENAFKGCSEDLTIYCMFDSQPETWHENWNPDDRKVVWCCIGTWDVSATEEDNVTAKLYNNINNEGYYTLIISGSGNMINYDYQLTPWYNYITNINSVLILNGVANIGDRAIQECSSLTSIVIPNSVTSIGQQVFQGCTSLTSITISDGITSIGEYAFSNCTSLTSINIPNSVTSINNSTFYKCTSLTSITIPDSVISIGDGAFSSCTSLTSINIPDGITSIGNSAFSSCTSLTSINIPNSVTDIGYDAFYKCHMLSKVYITDILAWCNISFINSVGGTPLYYGADLYLNGKLLTEIVIPDNKTAMGLYDFYGCESLTAITIPDSVTVIDLFAFQNCINLISINYTGTIAQWDKIKFTSGYSSWDDNTGNYTIHCTDGDIAKDGTITYHTT